jgi:hypothetical protein
MVHDIQVILAFCFFSLALLKAPDVIRVEWDITSKFSKFIATVQFLKVAILATLISRFAPEIWMRGVDIFNSIPARHLLGVWWEDCFYVLPYLLLTGPILAIRNKWLRRAAIGAAGLAFVATTLHFAVGHLYQGPIGWTAIVYPILSYRVGRAKGLGTMMILHVVFDFTIYMAMMLAMALAGAHV